MKTPSLSYALELFEAGRPVRWRIQFFSSGSSRQTGVGSNTPPRGSSKEASPC
jgi:hypothetical protein